MRFYSTNGQSPDVDLAEAVMTGLAPDGGLYMPESLPKLPKNLLMQMGSMPFQDIAFEVSKKLFLEDIPEEILRSIVNEAFNFKVPFTELEKNLYALELFHGPTLSFKDFAARFMARLIAYLKKQSKKQLTVLVATSGDTGSAVAHGFLGLKGINVVILYPSGKVSNVQEKELTTMGKNITTLEVQGTFDDCQKMVKQAFADKNINKNRFLISANSINIARLLPQSFYYFYICAKLKEKGLPMVVSVPSGNFGNLTAGLMAKKMGAPIHKFIASTNDNDTVPRYLETGNFRQKPAIETISNAMDVGNPSNFVRILKLYNDDIERIRQDIYGVSFSDKKTREAIKKVYRKYNYVMDPHGAVAYLGLVEYRKILPDSIGVFLETAHPAKFADVIEKTIKRPVAVPEKLKVYLRREKKSFLIENKFSDLKKFLLE